MTFQTLQTGNWEVKEFLRKSTFPRIHPFHLLHSINFDMNFFVIFRQITKNESKIRTGASPGTFFTVSGTARMVPAEDLNVHVGTK